MKYKKCTKCRKLKPFTGFYKDKRATDGLYSICKTCHNKDTLIWQKNNPEKASKASKKWIKNNPHKLIKARKKFIKKHPWYNTWTSIEARCKNPKCGSYPWYGGKGIKNLLTIEDLEYLWFRDRAYEMKKPSIDRKNSGRHYTLKNCRYLELKENKARRKYKQKRKKK